MDTALTASKGTNLSAVTLLPVPDTAAVESPTAFPENDCLPEASPTEDTVINGQPCPPGSIPECSYQAEPVKSRPATHTLNAVFPLNRHAAPLITAKQVTLLACNLTMVSVQLLG